MSSGKEFYLPQFKARLLARILARPHPAELRHIFGVDTEILAVPGRYSVSYLIMVSDGIAIVDVGSCSDINRIIDLLVWFKRPLNQIRYLIPSHLHFDHIMGMDMLGVKLGVPIAMGKVASEIVAGRRKQRWPKKRTALWGIYGWLKQGMPFMPLVDLKNGMDFGFPWSKNRFKSPVGPIFEHNAELPGFPGWKVLSTPGHADEAICLYHERSGFLVAGDVMGNFYGGEWNILVCDEEQYAHTKNLLKTLSIKTIMPGHGPILEGDRIIEKLKDLSLKDLP